MVLRGRILEYDKWKRLRVAFPDSYLDDKTDSMNTRKTLAAADARYPGGWSPISYQTFLAKTDAKTIAYDAAGDRVTDLASMLGHEADFEVEILPFAGDGKGWFIRVTGIRFVKK